MSTFIHDMDKYITDFNQDFDVSNIMYSKDHKIGYYFYYFHVYNKNIEIPLHKFWFLLNNTRITVLKDSFSIVFINNDTNKKFTSYVSNIESHTIQSLEQRFSIKMNLKKSSFDINSDGYLEMHISKTKNIKIFNNNGDKISKLNKKNNCTVLIEISKFMYNDNELWIIWKILHIYVNAKIDLTQSIFKNSKQTEIIIPPPPTISSYTSRIEPPSQKKVVQETKFQMKAFAVSTHELINTRNLLRKTTKNDLLSEDVISDVNMIVELPNNEIKNINLDINKSDSKNNSQIVIPSDANIIESPQVLEVLNESTISNKDKIKILLEKYVEDRKNKKNYDMNY